MGEVVVDEVEVDDDEVELVEVEVEVDVVDKMLQPPYVKEVESYCTEASS